MTVNPYESPQACAEVVGVLSGLRQDLRLVAIYQKVVIAALGIGVICYMTSIASTWGPRAQPGSPGPLVLLVLTFSALGLLFTLVVGAVFVFLLSMKVNGFVWGFIMAAASLVPCLGLLALVLVNQKATRVLTQNGIRVGFFGARLADVMAPTALEGPTAGQASSATRPMG